MAENEELTEDEELEPFTGEEALALAREGKDAWNAWAEGNPGREVDFLGVDFTTEENKRISFEGFVFPGNVTFSYAQFDTVPFERTTFYGVAEFIETNFRYTSFGEASFEDEVNFITTFFDGATGFFNTTFKKSATFMGSTFNGPVNLLGCWFWIPPDFRGTVFKKHVSLHGIAVDFRLSPKFADADIYRRLKEIAFTARDHDCEQLFFAYELKAKRRFEAMDLGLISNYLYEWTSNFGRSLTLPSFLLVSTWFIFGILYRWLETANTPNHIWDGLSFSTEQLFLFLGASKGASSDSRLALYSEAPLSIAVNALAMTEGVLGIIFIFLIGLALRNRFRI